MTPSGKCPIHYPVELELVNKGFTTQTMACPVCVADSGIVQSINEIKITDLDMDKYEIVEDDALYGKGEAGINQLSDETLIHGDWRKLNKGE